MGAEIYKLKEAFVNDLSDFYINKVGNHLGINKLQYECDDCEEWVYVIWDNQQKRFSVWGDSIEAIMKDFTKFLNEYHTYPWLREEQRWSNGSI